MELLYRTTDEGYVVITDDGLSADEVWVLFVNGNVSNGVGMSIHPQVILDMAEAVQGRI